MCPPKFSKELSDLTVNDGESLTLTCHVKGDPEPRITWTKNKKVAFLFYVFQVQFRILVKLRVSDFLASQLVRSS